LGTCLELYRNTLGSKGGKPSPSPKKPPPKTKTKKTFLNP